MSAESMMHDVASSEPQVPSPAEIEEGINHNAVAGH